MKAPAHILVVDDITQNVKLLVDLLAAKGYQVQGASSGEQALAAIADSAPDLVLLDVVMPGLDGYEVCRRIRTNPATRMLPVIMVTALDPTSERVKGIESGADDFITKPFSHAELLARVRSLLRIKDLHDTVEAQAQELAHWNKELLKRVEEQVAQLERLSRLKRFFSPQLAELIIRGGTEDPLISHRREITVVFLDLRGFTHFAEVAEPDEVMRVLREYHAAMGELILEYEGTLERFAGDGIMVFFNDPLPIDDPVGRAVAMALAMRARIRRLVERWNARGFELDFGFGIAQGQATLGAIGFEGRSDYAAIGSVTNLAARLCAEARAGQALTDQNTLRAIKHRAQVKPLGDLTLRGFSHPIPAFDILELRPR
ncbi:MAG: response regulator [Pseudomonadota bacterium]|nr:MAG: response regulator [Pseudomonadota bacterium]